MRTVHEVTRKGSRDHGGCLKITGTVAKVMRRRSEMGNLVLTVDVVLDSSGFQTRLRYLQVRQPIPVKGQHVSISGVPLDLKGRKPNTNIGAVKLSIG